MLMTVNNAIYVDHVLYNWTSVTLGTYKTTQIDSTKTNADFRLTQVAPNYIVWQDGKSEIVTSAKLKKLQAQFSWVTDF